MRKLVAAVFLVVFGLLLTTGAADAGEPEYGCDTGILVGTQCEVEAAPPRLTPPCPAPANGGNTVAAIDGQCYEVFPKGNAVDPCPAGQQDRGMTCTIPVDPTGPAVLVCTQPFELSGDRCLHLLTARCTTLSLVNWLDDNGDGIRQAGEGAKVDVDVIIYESSPAGVLGAPVYQGPLSLRGRGCVMSGSYVIEVSSGNLTMNGATGGDDDSDIDPVSRRSGVITLAPLESAALSVGLLPATPAVPLELAFGDPVFSCTEGFSAVVGGGEPPYRVRFSVSLGGGLTSLIGLGPPQQMAAVAGPHLSGVPYAQRYEPGQTYPVTATIWDATGRSLSKTSSFEVGELCAPGPRPAPEPTVEPTPEPTAQPTAVPAAVRTAPIVVAAEAEAPPLASAEVSSVVATDTETAVASTEDAAATTTGLAYTGVSRGLAQLGFAVLGLGAAVRATARLKRFD